MRLRSGYLVIVLVLAVSLSFLACRSQQPSPPPPPLSPLTVDPPDEPLLTDLEFQEDDQYADVLIERLKDKAEVNVILSLKSSKEMARGEIRSLEAKGNNRSPEEKKRKRELIARFNRLTRELHERLSQTAHLYNIDFFDLNQTKLTQDGLRALELIRDEFTFACSTGRQVVIAGFGCPIGGREVTLKISEDRARTIALWIAGHTSCKLGQVEFYGKGVDSRVRDMQDEDDPEVKKLLALARHAYILIAKGFSGEMIRH